MAQSLTAGFQAPTVSYGQAGGGIRIPVGSPVYQDANGQYWAATASDLSKCPAVGVVASASSQNFTVGVINAGFLTLYNWKSVTGTLTLTPGATYYLSLTAGQLTTTAPGSGAVITQAIGQATSSTTMQVLGNVSNSPPSGITLTLNTADGLLGAYWTLNFQNGLLASATHHAAVTPDVILPDGSGGFWKLIVNSSGAVGTLPNAGPASPDVILEDINGGFWKIVVDTVGNRGTESNIGPATTPIPVLLDELGNAWEVVVDTAGDIGALAQ